MSETIRQPGLVFSDIARYRNTIFDKMMVSVGLTHAQARVLNHLFRNDGLTQTELSESMGVGTVTVSGLVDRLEARGWVRRQPDDKDRRAKRVWLTENVDEIRELMSNRFEDLNNLTLSGLTDAEVEFLIARLKRIRQNLFEELNAKNETRQDKSD